MSEVKLKQYIPPLKDAASKLKTLVLHGFGSSKGENNDNTSEPLDPLWIELWIAKSQTVPQIVRSP